MLEHLRGLGTREEVWNIDPDLSEEGHYGRVLVLNPLEDPLRSLGENFGFGMTALWDKSLQL